MNHHVRRREFFGDKSLQVIGDLVGLDDGELIWHNHMHVDISLIAREPAAQSMATKNAFLRCDDRANGFNFLIRQPTIDQLIESPLGEPPGIKGDPGGKKEGDKSVSLFPTGNRGNRKRDKNSRAGDRIDSEMLSIRLQRKRSSRLSNATDKSADRERSQRAGPHNRHSKPELPGSLSRDQPCYRLDRNIGHDHKEEDRLTESGQTLDLAMAVRMLLVRWDRCYFASST